MKQYLKITNQGLIVEEDLMLIGSSTKRDDNTKIGMFGSGWKYALAWLIRNDCTPIILSGNRSIEIDYKPVVHRNNPVRVITVGGRETSLTAEMGPQWLGWMAIREIVSNAIDEGGYSVDTVTNPVFVSEPETTVVYIPMEAEELREVMMSYHKYFAFERKATIQNEHGSIYLRKTAADPSYYRKGIRCYNSEGEKPRFLDFNFESIQINESRLAERMHIKHGVRNILRGSGITSEVLKAFLLDEYDESYFCGMNSNIEDCLRQLHAEGHTFTTQSMINLIGIHAGSEKSLKVHTEWYSYLVKIGVAKSLFEFMDGSSTPFIVTNKRDTSMIMHYLNKFNINIEVVSGKFDAWSSVIVTSTKAVILESSSNDDKTLAAQIIREMPNERLIELM